MINCILDIYLKERYLIALNERLYIIMEAILKYETEPKKRGKPKGIKRYKENPFIDKMNIKLGKTKINYFKVLTNEPVTVGDKQIGESLYTKVEHEVSGEQFVKLYSRYASIWFDLSPAALKMFGLFYTMILCSPPNMTYFYLSQSDPILVRYIKTPNTFHKAINELIKNEIIDRHFSEGWYWVNPYVMGRGDQLKIITELKLKNNKSSHAEIGQFLDSSIKGKVKF